MQTEYKVISYPKPNGEYREWLIISNEKPKFKDWILVNNDIHEVIRVDDRIISYIDERFPYASCEDTLCQQVIASTFNFNKPIPLVEIKSLIGLCFGADKLRPENKNIEISQLEYVVELEMEIDERIEPIITGNYPHKDDYTYKVKVDGNGYVNILSIK